MINSVPLIAVLV